MKNVEIFKVPKIVDVFPKMSRNEFPGLRSAIWTTYVPIFSNIVVFPAAPNDAKRIALFTWADPEVSL